MLLTTKRVSAGAVTGILASVLGVMAIRPSLAGSGTETPLPLDKQQALDYQSELEAQDELLPPADKSVLGPLESLDPALPPPTGLFDGRETRVSSEQFQAVNVYQVAQGSRLSQYFAGVDGQDPSKGGVLVDIFDMDTGELEHISISPAPHGVDQQTIIGYQTNVLALASQNGVILGYDMVLQTFAPLTSYTAQAVQGVQDSAASALPPPPDNPSDPTPGLPRPQIYRPSVDQTFDMINFQVAATTSAYYSVMCGSTYAVGGEQQEQRGALIVTPSSLDGAQPLESSIVMAPAGVTALQCTGGAGDVVTAQSTVNGQNYGYQLSTGALQAIG